MVARIAVCEFGDTIHQGLTRALHLVSILNQLDPHTICLSGACEEELMILGKHLICKCFHVSMESNTFTDLQVKHPKFPLLIKDNVKIFHLLN